MKIACDTLKKYNVFLKWQLKIQQGGIANKTKRDNEIIESIQPKRQKRGKREQRTDAINNKGPHLNPTTSIITKM